MDRIKLKLAATDLANRTTTVLMLAQLLDENQRMCRALMQELEKDENKAIDRKVCSPVSDASPKEP